MQPDPKGLEGAKKDLPQSLNRYSYVGNDPVNQIDPLGTNWIPINPCSFIICDSVTVTANVNSGNIPVAPGIIGGGAIVAELLDGNEGGGGQLHIPLFVDLPAEKLNALMTAMGVLLDALYNPSESCLNKVINPLAEKFGFGVAEFYNYLNQGAKFYDGTATLAPVAGNVTTPAAANALYGPSASIASVFGQTRTDPATGATLRTDALTSITTPIFTAYFRPSAIDSSGTPAGLARNAGLLFHEALHGFGGTLGGTSYFDDDLKDAFRLIGAGSDSISEHISKNCLQ
jgi:hypothetical protein